VVFQSKTDVVKLARAACVALQVALFLCKSR